MEEWRDTLMSNDKYFFTLLDRMIKGAKACSQMAFATVYVMLCCVVHDISLVGAQNGIAICE